MSGIGSSSEGAGIVSLPIPAEGLEAIGRLTDGERERNLRLAKRWISEHHLNAAWFSPDDAIDEALLVLCRRICTGTVRPVSGLAEFRRRFRSTLKQVIVDRRRRQHAGKRDARRTISLSLLVESGFDRIDERARRSEEIASGKEQLRRRLDLLRRRDRRLRAIAVMKMKEYANDAMARLLKVSIPTVERMSREIRSILEADRDDRE